MENLISQLSTIYGIGPGLAAKIIEKLKLNPDKNYTIGYLRELLKSKLYSELPIATKHDLTYNPLKIIPRHLIDIINTELHKYVKNYRFTIAGSYYRGKSTSSDIDIVMIKKENFNFDNLMETINKSKIIKAVKPFASGPDKIAFLLKAHNQYVKVDIFLTNKEECIFALLYAIGSGKFNQRMRAVAKRQSYLLNQKGLYKISSGKKIKIPIKNEKEIFSKLGMEYLAPKDRIK